MIRQVVRVPMGTAQAAVYKFHLEADYRDKHDRKAIGAQIREQSDAAQLVLDGHLPGEEPEEVNLAALLKIAEAEFAAAQNTRIGEQATPPTFAPVTSLDASALCISEHIGKLPRNWLRCGVMRGELEQ